MFKKIKKDDSLVILKKKIHSIKRIKASISSTDVVQQVRQESLNIEKVLKKNF